MMNRRRTWRTAAILAGASLTLATAGVAGAHPTITTSDGGTTSTRHAHVTLQHGGDAGHLAAGNTNNIQLVSKLKLKNAVPEKIADVGVYKGYAYLAAWGVVTCKYNGVHVVNVQNPAAPREVAFIQAKEGSYPGEGVQALSIDTPKFKGDILVTNNEVCKDQTGFGGMNIYDITNPGHPTPLVEGIGDPGVPTPGQAKKAANEIHSVFAWDAGDRAYAVIVDNEEGTDVDIIDITDPRKAFLTAEYDLDVTFPGILQSAPGNLIEVFLHDVVVKEIGGRQVMLLSYWDAGYVKLDMTDVTKPVYLGDTDFTNPDPQALKRGLNVPPEGNAHEAEFTADNAYVIGSDEDFGPFALVARNTTDNTVINAGQGSGTKRLPEGATITGPSVFVGRACIGDTLVPPGNPLAVDIAVVERGVCTFTEKVTSVIAAGGYDAVLIFNRVGSDACNDSLGMSVEGNIPTFGVAPRQQAYNIFNVPGYDEAACRALPAGSQLAPIVVGTMGDILTFSSYFDGWGYVHLFRNNNGKMTELDTYAIPEAHNPAFATGFGDLSGHEVATSATDSRLLYFSYYSGGFRVAKITADEKLQEVGHYIDTGGNNFWGVQVFQNAGQEYVAASDRDLGLYIFKYNP